MALFEMDFPEDFMEPLLSSGFDEIAEDALNETAKILEDSMKKACRDVIKHDGDSELVDSISATKPKRTKTDAWIVNITPKGYSDKVYYRWNRRGRARYETVTNTLKAIWLEYGISGRQPARPFIQKACNRVRNDVMNRIQEIYNKKVGAE